MTWLPTPGPESTCVVTGASSGIGASIARQLAALGYGLTLVARREAALTELATQLVDQHGVDVDVIPCDLTAPDLREDLVERLGAAGRRVDVLVNNAGFGRSGYLIELEAGRELDVVRINCEAVADLSAWAAPSMVERRSGAILNVASTLAFQPTAGYATYAASKAFVLHFSEALHTELQRHRVAVSALCPGVVPQTEFESANGPQAGWKAVPKIFWSDVDAVARAGIRGLAANKRVVVPGAGVRALAAMGRHSPHAVQLPLMDRMFHKAK